MKKSKTFISMTLVGLALAIFAIPMAMKSSENKDVSETHLTISSAKEHPRTSAIQRVQKVRTTGIASPVVEQPLPMEPEGNKTTGSYQAVQALDELADTSDTASNKRSNLDKIFDQEAYDTEWAAKTENETWEEFYATELPKSDVENVECRTTLCRIAVVHEDDNAEIEFQQTLLAKLNGRAGYFEHLAYNNGKRITLLYRYR